MVLKARRKKRKKLSLKKAAEAISKLVWKYLVKLPEEERERDIAAFERAVSKKFKRLKEKQRR
jgi:hypothetical protein